MFLWTNTNLYAFECNLTHSSNTFMVSCFHKWFGNRISAKTPNFQIKHNGVFYSPIIWSDSLQIQSKISREPSYVVKENTWRKRPIKVKEHEGKNEHVQLNLSNVILFLFSILKKLY